MPIAQILSNRRDFSGRDDVVPIAGQSCAVAGRAAPGGRHCTPSKVASTGPLQRRDNAPPQLVVAEDESADIRAVWRRVHRGQQRLQRLRALPAEDDARIAHPWRQFQPSQQLRGPGCLNFEQLARFFWARICGARRAPVAGCSTPDPPLRYRARRRCFDPAYPTTPNGAERLRP